MKSEEVKRRLQLARARQRFGCRRIDGLPVLEGWRAGLSRGFRIRSDNGPEFIATEPRAWLALVGVSTLLIEPGSPGDNGFAESPQGRFRDESLAREVGDGLRDVRAITAARKDDSNHRRPRRSLGFQTPAGFAAACAAGCKVRPIPEPPHRPGSGIQPGLA